jgi:hypothetical protein
MYKNTQKILDLIKEEYNKEQERTNPSNAFDFLEEVTSGIRHLTRTEPVRLKRVTDKVKQSGLIGIYTDNENFEISGYAEENTADGTHVLVVVKTNPELEILEEIERLDIGKGYTLEGLCSRLEDWLEVHNSKLGF